MPRSAPPPSADPVAASASGLGVAVAPDAMMGLADNDALRTVATDAKQRLTAALAALDTSDGAS